MYKKISLNDSPHTNVFSTNNTDNKDNSSSSVSTKSQKIITNLYSKIEELQLVASFLERLENNPAIIFSEIDIFNQKKSPFFAAFASYYHKDDATSIHEVQLFFAEKANFYFQKWLRDNEIEGDFYINVRQFSTYPSLFAIFNENREIIQFDLFEKKYGSRYLVRNSLQKKKELEEQLIAISNLIHEMQDKKRFSSELKNKKFFFFSSNERTETLPLHSEGLDGLIEQQMHLQNKLRAISTDEQIKEHQKLFNLFSVLFRTYGFSLEENEGSLY